MQDMERYRPTRCLKVAGAYCKYRYLVDSDLWCLCKTCLQNPATSAARAALARTRKACNVNPCQ